MGDDEALRLLVDGEEIFHSNAPGASGVTFHLDASGTDQFQPFTAIFSIDAASPGSVTVRFSIDFRQLFDCFATNFDPFTHRSASRMTAPLETGLCSSTH